MRRFLAIGVAAIAVAAPLSTSAATASATAQWSRYWKSSCWDKVELHAKGTKVTGSFTWFAGSLVGTVKGSKLTGTWKAWPHYRGSFVFTLSSNGKKFQGHWKYRGKAWKSCSGTKTRG